MHYEQELSRIKSALEELMIAKTAAGQELQTAQQDAALAASQAAAAQEALKDAQAAASKVLACALLDEATMQSMCIKGTTPAAIALCSPGSLQACLAVYCMVQNWLTAR